MSFNFIVRPELKQLPSLFNTEKNNVSRCPSQFFFVSPRASQCYCKIVPSIFWCLSLVVSLKIQYTSPSFQVTFQNRGRPQHKVNFSLDRYYVILICSSNCSGDTVYGDSTTSVHPCSQLEETAQTKKMKVIRSDLCLSFNSGTMPNEPPCDALKITVHFIFIHLKQKTVKRIFGLTYSHFCCKLIKTFLI